jgi:hypothetical protein
MKNKEDIAFFEALSRQLREAAVASHEKAQSR